MPMPATLNESTITTQLPESSEPKPIPRLRRWAEALGWSPNPCRLVATFLRDVSAATRRDEVHNLLLRAAQELTGAARVEVRPVGGPKRVMQRRAVLGRPSEDALQLPIRFRGDHLGHLLVTPWDGRTLTPAMIDHLETLCSIAAIGDRLLGRERQLRVSLPAEPDPMVSRNTMLMPFLRQLVLLARRRREPLGLLAIGVDPQHEAGSEPEVEALLGTIRESDLIVRYDDRTLIAVLPNASATNTTLIAESVARSILEASGWSEMSGIAIGAASLPDDAREADVLLDVAIEALRRSREDGIGQVVVADRDAFVPRMAEEFGEPVAG